MLETVSQRFLSVSYRLKNALAANQWIIAAPLFCSFSDQCLINHEPKHKRIVCIRTVMLQMSSGSRWNELKQLIIKLKQCYWQQFRKCIDEVKVCSFQLLYETMSRFSVKHQFRFVTVHTKLDSKCDIMCRLAVSCSFSVWWCYDEFSVANKTFKCDKKRDARGDLTEEYFTIGSRPFLSSSCDKPI